MKVEFKITLDKNNEAEIAYCKMLDMSFASYNIMKNIQPDLPEFDCEVCDCDSEIEYKIHCVQELTVDDLENLWSKLLDTGDIDENS